MEKKLFNFYGITVELICPGVLSSLLEKDFLYFLDTSVIKPDKKKVSVTVHIQKPPYDLIKTMIPVFKKSDAVIYGIGSSRYVDYNGKALSIYDFEKDRGSLYSESLELLHELTYLLIHSRAGELLDKKGMHRVHALGVTGNGKGVLCLMPEGAGKTTLGLDLLEVLAALNA